MPHSVSKSHRRRGAANSRLTLQHLILVHVFEVVNQVLSGRALLQVRPKHEVSPSVRAEESSVIIDILGRGEQQLKVALALLLLLIVGQNVQVVFGKVNVPFKRDTRSKNHGRASLVLCRSLR